MSSLPGNDHAAVSKFRTEGLHDFQSREGMTDATHITTAIDANTEATLALAFEQRTATLVSLHQYAADKLIDGHVHGDEEEYAAHLEMLRDEINLRIGKPNDEAFSAG